MSRTGWSLAALAGAAALLVIAAWFDTVFLRDALRLGASTFDASGTSAVVVLGSVLVAGSAVAVWVLATRARSLVVGVAYVVAGGFLAALPWLVWNFAARTGDGPPAMPEPLLTVVSEIYSRSTGSLNAVGTIGAAMLIAGVGALVLWQRDRSAVKGGIEAMSSTAVEPNRS